MNNIVFNNNIYPSGAYYVLKQLGLVPGHTEPRFLELGKQISALGKSFSFKASLAGGPLFKLIYQIPSYLEITPIEFDKFFQVISNFIKYKDINIFLEKWPDKTNYFKQWYTQGWISALSKSVDHDPARALAIIETFLLILHDSWDEYSSIYKEKISNLSTNFINLEKECNSHNIFSRWEKSFGNQYPYDKLEIITCPESNALANSLGPEKLVIGSSKIDNCLNTCIHEVGVRTIDLNYLSTNVFTKDILINDYRAIQFLIEMEVCYRKKEIFPEIKVDKFVSSMNLEKLLEWRNNKSIDKELAKSFAYWYKELKELGIL